MSNIKKPIVMLKGKEENLPYEAESNTIYFAEDTGNIYKSEKDGGALIPFSSVVGVYEDLVELETAIRIEGKLYILKEEGQYTIYTYDSKVGFLPITSQQEESEDISIKQVTKLNVEATKEDPYIVEIPIPYSADFKKLPIEVLKMEGEAEEGVVNVLADFDNSETDNFEENEFIEMDGTMSLRTLWEFECDTINSELGFYSFDMKNLDKIETLNSFDIK